MLPPSCFSFIHTCHIHLVWNMHSKEQPRSWATTHSASLGAPVLPSTSAARSLVLRVPFVRNCPFELPWQLVLGQDLRTAASLEMQLPQFHGCVQNCSQSNAFFANCLQDPDCQCPSRLHPAWGLPLGSLHFASACGACP